MSETEAFPFFIDVRIVRSCAMAACPFGAIAEAYRLMVLAGRPS